MSSANLKIVRTPYSGKPNNKLVSMLADCNLTSAELARRVDVFPSTVSAWVTGKATPPGAVFAYLDLLAKVRSASK